jgi:hypothetical protein
LCKKYGAAYVSDNQSSLEFWVRDSSLARVEKTGTRTSSFYICSACDELVLVTCEIENRLYAVINSRVIAGEHFKAAEKESFTSETLAERLARRKQNWVPSVSRIS